MERIEPLELTGSIKTPQNSSGITGHRPEFVAKQIRRTFISARTPIPEPGALSLLVDDALRLWREIPEADLTGAVEAAIIEAGNFPASAGLVARCWSRSKVTAPLSLGYVQGAPKVLQEAAEWDKWWNGMTDEARSEERRKHREFFAGLSRRTA